MNDILEPEGYRPLQKDQLIDVLSDQKADYHAILSMHDLERFKLVEVAADNKYSDSEYLLYARNKRVMRARTSQNFNRRSTLSKRRSSKRSRRSNSSAHLEETTPKIQSRQDELKAPLLAAPPINESMRFADESSV